MKTRVFPLSNKARNDYKISSKQLRQTDNFSDDLPHKFPNIFKVKL
jgi:hypothetical protein